MGKTFGAVACVIVTLIIWVEALAALLRYARAGDPGAYIMVGGVFLLLPGAVVVLLVLLSIDRVENRERAQSRVYVPAPRPIAPQPVAPPQVTTTTNVYIDTVNVYQAAAPVEEPQTIPAEVRRIRPAIGR